MLAERLTAQLLSGPPAADPVAATRHLLAVQAQDPRGARLAIRVRVARATSGDVDRCLTDDRSLVITWLNRGTLHLVTSEDLSWLHALTTPPLRNANARRLHQEGVSEAAAERGVQAIVRALADEGPLTRGQLRERVAAAGVRTEGQALVHVLMLATLRGLTVRGPMVAGEQAYALVADWLGELAPVSRDRALAELAHRFLAGHGPASDRDLAKWSGLPLRDARAGLRAISGQLDEHAGGEVTLRRARPAGAELPPPRLLGAFEPALMGWTSREWILGSYTPIVVTGGLFRPFALVDGRAAATWQIRRGQIELTPFAELRPGTEAALHADGRAVLDYLGR